MDKLQTLADYLKAPISQFFNFDLKATPDPLTEELLEHYNELSNEDKLLIRALTIRLNKER